MQLYIEHIINIDSDIKKLIYVGQFVNCLIYLFFQPPQAVEKWDGIKETTKDGNRCYSVKKDTADESEDCLYLNVYTPVLDNVRN